MTLQEKIDKNIGFAVQMGMEKEQAVKLANSTLPKLKRWDSKT
jgi:hypothetical protein